MKTNPCPYSEIADAFVQARLKAKTLEQYPGPIPSSSQEAYAIQDLAIKGWPHQVGGWKVGGVSSEFKALIPEVRLAGPVFKNQIFHDGGDIHAMPVFDGGFAAIEAEIVFVLNDRVVGYNNQTSLEDLRNMVGSVHIGVEVASSPFSQINDLGPCVTISDFGNNNGLIIGQAIPNWQSWTLEDLKVETMIEGKSVGVASPSDPLAALKFLIENAKKRGCSLQQEDVVTTGAITGVHQAVIGQTGTIQCSGVEDINLKLVSQLHRSV